MASIGRFAVRYRFAIVAAWVAAVAACALTLPSLSSVEDANGSDFLPSGAPSLQAAQLEAPFLPPGSSAATIVASRSGSPLTAADNAALVRLEQAVGRLAHVSSVRAQGASADGSAALAAVVVDVGPTSPQAAGVVDAIRDRFGAVSAPSGLSLDLSGSIAGTVDQQRADAQAQTRTNLVTDLVILVALVVVLRSLVAPLVVLVPAVLALGLAQPVIASLTHAGLQVSAVTGVLLIVLMLGAGTDYGLFLVLRAREEMQRGLAPRLAVVRAVERVGESLSFSAGTVIVAMLCLLLASLGVYRSLGPALAVGIGLMLLAGLTLLPALMAIFGRLLFWPSRPSPGAARRQRLWVRVGDAVTRRPLPALCAGLFLFGALALANLGTATAGFDDAGSGPAGSDAGRGEDIVEQHFGAAVADPTRVVLRFSSSLWEDPSVLQTAQAQLASRGVFGSVNGLLNPRGTPVAPQQIAAIHARLGAPQNLPPTPPSSAIPQSVYTAYLGTAQFLSADGRTAQFLTTLSAGDPGSSAAMDSVPSVRSAVSQVASSVGAVDSGVVGLAPIAYDTSAASARDLRVVVPVVLVLIGVLLGAVLRSAVAPAYLVASVALSYAAALGVAAIIFVRIGGASGLNFVLPFLMFLFLLALGEDYNILVMSRIREEARRLPLRGAVAAALHATGTTVTAAGVILAATFAVPAVTGGTEQVRQLGTAIALGILMDTFLVRTLLVPTVVILLRRWNWWPSPMSRGAPAPVVAAEPRVA